MEGVGSWQDKLKDRIPDELGREVDIFETQMELRRRGEVDERLFAETRLRRGVYGQRYDNGQRHDGTQTRELEYRDHPTKGPETVWDAPGMVRIKIPYGKMSAEQVELMAELSEDYSDGISHVTTRQDIQLHFVHIEDTPDMMRRLAASGITTREACGNSVRNITACHLAGVCKTETFDVTPYAEALKDFLLGHPDVQDFGRKMKPAFSGCAHESCGLVNMHDVGYIAKTREVDGQVQRGFEFFVGGGLGAIPHPAQLLTDFVTEDELLPLTQAVCRVFARLGEKENRGRARIKFLVAKLGIEEFSKLVFEERETLPHDPRWTAYLQDVADYREEPAQDGSALAVNGEHTPAFRAWYDTNVRAQRQEGYAVATVKCPLGDLTADQMRSLASIAREFGGDNVRLTVEQNIVLRWVSQGDLPRLHAALEAADLAAPGAETIADLTSCPGTDTCKLGIAASRGLVAELGNHVGDLDGGPDDALSGLRIKASGCFNSCGQHTISDLGFYGISRKKSGRLVPHFQVVLGGQWVENGGSFGLATLAIPSKNIPEVVRRVTGRFVEEREPDETFTAFIARLGKVEVKSFLQDLTEIPTFEEDPSYYSDWGDPRVFTMEDYGEGECAGEIVPLVEFGLQASEREVFEAQLYFDAGDPEKAKATAYKAMLSAAQALVKTEFHDITDEPDTIVTEFKTRFHETKRFHDKFAGAKFANYLFQAHEVGGNGGRPEQARERVEEAQLFIEAAYKCYERIGTQGSSSVSGGDTVAPLMSPEVSVKLFVDDSSVVRPLELIGVFHRWIKDGSLEDELVIDVANYEHVPKGPGIVLICDKAHYYFDVRDDRWGMRYRGRRAARATGEEAIARAFRSALHAASLLENDPTLEGRYRFRTDEVEFGIYDRLLAPSAQETLDAVRPALDATVTALYGEPATSLELCSSPKEPFMVSVRNSGSPDVSELLGKVTASAG